MPLLSENPRRHTAERQCLVCRTSAPKKSLLRLACTADGTVVADLTGRLPGRGAYCCVQRRCLSEVVRPGLLGRGFHRRVEAVDGEAFVADLHHQASQRLADALGVYAKGGAVVAGSDAIETAMAKQSPIQGLLLLATDAGSATARRWHHRAATADLLLHTTGNQATWGAALGRERCAVIWVCAPRAAKRVEWLLTLAAETASTHTD